MLETADDACFSIMERRLLICAAILLGLTRAGLSLLSFQKLRDLLRKLRLGATPRCDLSKASAWQVVSAVERAAHYLPLRSTCLTKALAAQVLLDWHGLESQLHIGVAKSAEDDLEAHAWLESEGTILIGDLDDLSRYTRLPQL